jgi:hypothetical protein
MADSRIHLLPDATTTAGMFIAIDKPGSVQAVRYPLDDVLPTSIYRCNTESVNSGEQTIAFLEPFPTGTSYAILPIQGYSLTEGYMYAVPYTPDVNGFKINFPFDVTFTYLALIIR